MKHENLCKALGGLPRPLIIVPPYPQHVSRSVFVEFERFNGLDWNRVRPDDINGFHGATTSITAQGWVYLFPRVFKLTVEHFREVAHSDFVDVYYQLISIRYDVSDAVRSLDSRQKKVIFEAYMHLVDGLGMDIFLNWTSNKETLRRLLIV